MQPRATINLTKATKLIDDRTSLTQKETTGKGGSRRRSGFAEEEEGYMFVEEGLGSDLVMEKSLIFMLIQRPIKRRG